MMSQHINTLTLQPATSGPAVAFAIPLNPLEQPIPIYGPNDINLMLFPSHQRCDVLQQLAESYLSTIQKLEKHIGIQVDLLERYKKAEEQNTAAYEELQEARRIEVETRRRERISEAANSRSIAANISAINDKHAAAIANLSDSHKTNTNNAIETALKEERLKNATSLEEMNRQHAASLEEMRRNHAAAIDNISKKKDLEIEELKMQAASVSLLSSASSSVTFTTDETSKALEIRIDAALNKIVANDKTILQLTALVKKLRSEASARRASIEHLTAENIAKQTTILNSNNFQSSNKNKKSSSSSTVNPFRSLYEEQLQVIKILNDELRSLREEIVAQNANATKKELSDSKTLLAQLQGKLAEVNDLSESNNKTINDQDRQITLLRAGVAHHLKIANETDNRNVTLQRKLKNAASCNADLQSRLDAANIATADMVNAATDDLRSQLETANKANADLQSSLDKANAVNKANVDLQSKLDAANVAKTALQSQLNVEKAANAALEAQTVAQKKTISDMVLSLVSDHHTIDLDHATTCPRRTRTKRQLPVSVKMEGDGSQHNDDELNAHQDKKPKYTTNIGSLTNHSQSPSSLFYHQNATDGDNRLLSMDDDMLMPRLPGDNDEFARLGRELT